MKCELDSAHLVFLVSCVIWVDITLSGGFEMCTLKLHKFGWVDTAICSFCFFWVRLEGCRLTKKIDKKFEENKPSNLKSDTGGCSIMAGYVVHGPHLCR